MPRIIKIIAKTYKPIYKSSFNVVKAIIINPRKI
ncbi:hypothetical protein H476_3486, partial [[Clostridium] sordellii VPI 9048]